MLPCCPDQRPIQKFGIHIQNLLVALLPRRMTTSKFRYIHSRRACCPVAQTNDELKFLAYTFKIWLLPCCLGEWRLQNFDLDVRNLHVALLPRLTTNSKIWHKHSKSACCPVAQANDDFKISIYTFEKNMLPCCPEKRRIQNFGIDVRNLLVALLPRLTTNSKIWHTHWKSVCCPVAQANDDFKISIYTFEKSMLPCCPEKRRIQNFGIHIQNLLVALLHRRMTTSKFWYIHSRRACCPD